MSFQKVFQFSTNVKVAYVLGVFAQVNGIFLNSLGGAFSLVLFMKFKPNTYLLVSYVLIHI